MSTPQSSGVREAVTRILVEQGHVAPIAADESLFLSGKLDSVAAMEVLMLLERDFGIDLSDADFDITQLDSLAQIEELAGRRPN